MFEGTSQGAGVRGKGALSVHTPQASFHCHSYSRAERMIVIKDIGIQRITRYYGGRESYRFVESNKIQAIVINEGKYLLHMHSPMCCGVQCVLLSVVFWW